MRLVVLTGAGISAESGVPTFRDAGGLWEGHRVEDVATPEAFERDADTVHRWPQVYGIAKAERLSRGAIEYADLRFEDRIVIRRTSNVLESAQPPAVAR